jgi:hypothetical protein
MEKNLFNETLQNESSLNFQENERKEVIVYLSGLKSSMQDVEFKIILTKIEEIILNEAYFTPEFLENFKEILKLSKEKLVFVEKNDFDLYYDLLCLSEFNFTILLLLCKEFNRTKIQEKSVLNANDILLNPQHEYPETYMYSNKTDERRINLDLMNLINLKFFFESFLCKFLDYLIEYNNLIRNKDFLTNLGNLESRLSEIFTYKFVIRKIEYIFDIIFFSLKYIFSPSKNILKSQLEFNLNNISDVSKSLFSLIFEYLLLNYKQHAASINDKFITLPYFENFLTMSTLITSVISEIKFYASKLSYGIDFYHFCPTFSESFANFFFSHLSLKFVSKINDYLSVVENIKNYNFEKFDKFYFSPYSLSLCKESLSDFLIIHFKSFYINENNYEVENKSSWLKPLIQSFCFINFLEKLYQVIVNYLNSKENFYLKKNTMTKPSEEKVLKDIFSILITDLEKVKIIIPRRLIILKEYINLTNLIIFNYILIKLPCGDLVHSFLHTQDLFENLNEFKKFQNKFFFILCNNILKILMKGDYLHELRVYSSQSLPFDYYDIKENTVNVNCTSVKRIDCNPKNKSNGKKTSSGIKNYLFQSDITVTVEEITHKTEFIEFQNENFIIKNKENVDNNIKMTINNFPSKLSKKSPQSKVSSISFEITDLKFLNMSFLKSFENKTSKKIKFSSNKKGEFFIKFKNSNQPSVVVLTQTDKDINLVSKDFSNHLNSCTNLSSQSQSFQFLKEMLSQELLPKFDIDFILSLECENSEENIQVSQNLTVFPENKKNSLLNLQTTLKYYDVNNDYLTNDEITLNIINLFN